jgi:E3 ubiquitin-protein ligase NEDD4
VSRTSQPSWNIQILITHRRASEDSILAVQIFDQKKFKKKDQGFLGVINVRVGDVVDFSSGQDRE